MADVKLVSPDGASSVAGVSLLIDTGADITLLPPMAVERLGVRPLPQHRYEVMGFDGTTTLAPVVVLDMVFLDMTFRGRYLVAQHAQGILGRDVLNHVALLLDGPRQQWTQHSPS
ncbi:MAG: retropepsin-like aspartic protease [Candidatus Brocadiia bacterium]